MRNFNLFETTKCSRKLTELTKIYSAKFLLNSSYFRPLNFNKFIEMIYSLLKLD